MFDKLRVSTHEKINSIGLSQTYKNKDTKQAYTCKKIGFLDKIVSRKLTKKGHN